jgi:hypothetical protein
MAKSLPLPGIQQQFLGCPAHRLVITQITQNEMYNLFEIWNTTVTSNSRVQNSQPIFCLREKLQENKLSHSDIRGSHSSDYKDCRLLGYDSVI